MGPASEITQAVIDLGALRTLFVSLVRRGYCPVGPALRDGSIVYDTLSQLEDLPAGWTDEQSPGKYRLQKESGGALFRFAAGPQSWKKFLHPPEIRLFQIHRNDGQFQIQPDTSPSPRYAFIGVRACDLAAIRIQDRVLLHDRFADPVYQSRRQGVFIVAVNCTRPAATCFCASMNTGPRAREGFDLALTEMIEDTRHLFLVETGSALGSEILAELPHQAASAEFCGRAADAVEQAGHQTRGIDNDGLRELLAEAFYHPHWDAVAARCLACTNCTMVCPTCFCTNVEDTTSLPDDSGGNHAERWRRWDSCFSQAFSYIHGGSVRKSIKSRYRQWMTHKLSTWVDQFGTSGCVGCGRCITWCPAGIDITEEARAIREQPLPLAAFVEDEDGDA